MIIWSKGKPRFEDKILWPDGFWGILPRHCASPAQGSTLTCLNLSALPLRLFPKGRSTVHDSSVHFNINPTPSPVAAWGVLELRDTEKEKASFFCSGLLLYGFGGEGWDNGVSVL